MDDSPIHVHVRYYNIIRDIVGRSEEDLTIARGTTFRSLLAGVIARKHPKAEATLLLRSGEVSPYTRVFRNNRLVGEGDLADPLEDGDEVLVFPAVGGG